MSASITSLRDGHRLVSVEEEEAYRQGLQRLATIGSGKKVSAKSWELQHRHRRGYQRTARCQRRQTKNSQALSSTELIDAIRTPNATSLLVPSKETDPCRARSSCRLYVY